jgi:hypothetical protein
MARIGGRVERLHDKYGTASTYGTVTRFARANGLSRQAVTLAVRSGALVINPHTGDIEHDENYRPGVPPPLTSLDDICNALLRFIHNTSPVDPATAEAACFTIVDTARCALNSVKGRQR